MKEICLNWYYTSPKGYKMMASIMRLPSRRTLRTWQSSMKINPGINKSIMDSLKIHFKNPKQEHKKLCSILIDEISIKKELSYDRSSVKIVGVLDTGDLRDNKHATSALVCMARGITYNWKMVIGYWLLTSSDTTHHIYDIVQSCITSLSKAGLIVKAIICDQGPANQNLAKKLSISEDKTYLEMDGNKIYFIYDPPHLLKSLGIISTHSHQR